MTRRRQGAAIAVVIAILLAAAYLVTRSGGEAPGPLLPQQNILGYGFEVPEGTTFSFVIFLTAAAPVTVTLDSVSLRDPSPGLELVGTAIVKPPLNAQHLTTYPPAGIAPSDMAPVSGLVVTTHPDDSSTQIALGIHVPSQPSSLSASGVWVDYESGGRRYRSLLPWLLNVCTYGAEGSCNEDVPDTAEFTFPP